MLYEIQVIMKGYLFIPSRCSSYQIYPPKFRWPDSGWEDGFWVITSLGVFRAHHARCRRLPSQLGITCGTILGSEGLLILAKVMRMGTKLYKHLHDSAVYVAMCPLSCPDYFKVTHFYNGPEAQKCVCVCVSLCMNTQGHIIPLACCFPCSFPLIYKFLRHSSL